jgi:hypothetical protein
LPEDQYCHDATGARITTTGTWAGNTLMNPSDQAWWRTLLAHVNAGLERSGYDEVFLDTLGRGALLYSVTGRCVDSRTGHEYTAADWERDTSELARFIKLQTGRPVIANGASSGTTYFGIPPSSIISQYVDGELSEGFTRNGALYDGFSTEAQIVKDVRMVADTPTMHVLVKDWRSVSEGTKDQEMRYALAAFLLGTGGNDMFGWTGSRTVRTAFDPLWDVDLGTPQGPYYGLGGGRYRRDFARGHVLLDTVAHTGSIDVPSTDVPGVAWTTSGAGAFELTPCAADPGGTVTCEARYVPASGSAGTATITATSIGADGAAGPAGSTSIGIARRSSVTAVTCATPVTLPSASTCTVTVRDEGVGDAIAPRGSVDVSVGSGGIDSMACSLLQISGSASSCTVEFTPTADGTFQLTAGYAGGLDHEASASPQPASVTAESSQPDPAPAPDDVAPSVEITSPLDGTALARGTKVTITVLAADEVGVTSVVFAVNGAVKCTDTAPEWTCSWTAPGAAKTFVLTATASDAAGNVSSDTNTVTTVRT